MRSSWLTVLAFLVVAVPRAQADEAWSCSFVTGFSLDPAAVTYRVAGQGLIATWATGAEEDFRLITNNRFGLVAVSSSTDIAPCDPQPTVEGGLLVINRGTHEFRLARLTTSAVPGQEDPANQPIRGICVPN